MRLIWAAWEQYLYWQQTDRAILRKINTLLKECQRTPFAGTSKPEVLKGDLRGYWSQHTNAYYFIKFAVIWLSSTFVSQSIHIF